MRNIDIVIGNSSSGIIEAPYFNIPTINIGDRQKNRLASQSVIPCSDSVKSLRQSISKAFSMIGDNNIKHMDKIYGDGLASKKIEKEIYLLLDNLSSQKIFYDVNMENRS
jgi:UDP-N-acetylglucosamine 2-epimerase